MSIQAGYLKAVSSGGGLPELPPGTYIPKNSISGSFDLLWEGVTANSDTDVGIIKKNSGSGTWNGSGYANIDHYGNFTLEFKIDFSTDGSNAMMGLDFYKANNDYAHIDFCIYRTGVNMQIFESGVSIFSYPTLVNDSTLYSIEKNDDMINYKVDSVTIHTSTLQNNGSLNLDCSILDLATINEIKVIVS